MEINVSEKTKQQIPPRNKYLHSFCNFKPHAADKDRQDTSRYIITATFIKKSPRAGLKAAK
jgi:hypothetical protein